MSRTLFVAFAFAVCGVYVPLQLNLADTDLWGHLFFGRQIAETMDVLRRDIYSFSAYGTPCVSHEWLFQFAWYEVYARFGTTGLFLAREVFIVCTLGLLFGLIARRSESLSVRLASFFVTASICFLHFLFRPQIVTLTGLALIVFLLERGPRTASTSSANAPRWLPWILVPWSWFHGGFLAGAGILLLAAAGDELTTWIVPTALSRRRPARRLMAATIGALAATCLNPYGTSLWTRLYKTMTMRVARHMITEWQPVWAFESRVPLFIVLAYAAVAGIRFAASRNKKDLPQWLLAGAGIAAGASSVRHLPFTALLNAAPLTRLLDSARSRWASNPTTRQNRSGAAFLFINLTLFTLIGVVLVDAVYGTPRRRKLPLCAISIESGTEDESKTAEERPLVRPVYPRGAVEFIRRTHLSGKLWNDFNFGYYLIWHLYPRCLVFIDPRLDYSDEVMLDYQRVLRGSAAWRGILNRYDPDLVLLQTGAPILPHLLESGPWRPVYRDPDFVLLAKSIPRFRALIRSYRDHPSMSRRPPTPWAFP